MSSQDNIKLLFMFSIINYYALTIDFSEIVLVWSPATSIVYSVRPWQLSGSFDDKDQVTVGQHTGVPGVLQNTSAKTYFKNTISAAAPPVISCADLEGREWIATPLAPSPCQPSWPTVWLQLSLTSPAQMQVKGPRMWSQDDAERTGDKWEAVSRENHQVPLLLLRLRLWSNREV